MTSEPDRDGSEERRRGEGSSDSFGRTRQQREREILKALVHFLSYRKRARLRNRYTDVDIARSEAFLKRDAELRERILGEIRRPRTGTAEYVTALRDLYATYLNRKIHGFDAKGGRIDYSTLALASGRNLTALFVEVALAVEADQVFRIQERRRKRLLFGFLAERINRWRLERDLLAVAPRVQFELHAQVMFGEIAEKQLRAAKEYAQSLSEAFTDLAEALEGPPPDFGDDCENHGAESEEDEEEENPEEDALGDFRENLDRWRGEEDIEDFDRED